MGYRGVDDNPWQIVPLGRKKEKELLTGYATILTESVKQK